jgi:hypothetical protein
VKLKQQKYCVTLSSLWPTLTPKAEDTSKVGKVVRDVGKCTGSLHTARRVLCKRIDVTLTAGQGSFWFCNRQVPGGGSREI